MSVHTLSPTDTLTFLIAKKACLTAASSKERSPVLFRTSAIVLTAALALTACQRNPLKVTRNPCPAVAVPAYTGDVTLFSTPGATAADAFDTRSEEHTSELQSLIRISYAVFRLN